MKDLISVIKYNRTVKPFIDVLNNLSRREYITLDYHQLEHTHNMSLFMRTDILMKEVYIFYRNIKNIGFTFGLSPTDIATLLCDKFGTCGYDVFIYYDHGYNKIIFEYDKTN